MRILVDSHVALWWLSGSESLGSKCRDLIERADEAYFSVVTPWELGIKRALGKLDDARRACRCSSGRGFRSARHFSRSR